MAIGKLLPPCCSRRYAPAYRPDRTFAAGKLGHAGGSCDVGDLPEGIRGLVTPPLPFAEAERKASPNGPSIIRFPAKCLPFKSHFSQAVLTGAQGFHGLRGLAG